MVQIKINCKSINKKHPLKCDHLKMRTHMGFWSRLLFNRPMCVYADNPKGLGLCSYRTVRPKPKVTPKAARGLK